MDNITATFGKRIRNIRISKNISQEKLAELSGLHPTYIGQIERGEKSPTLESLCKISAGLSMSLSKLFLNIDTESKSGNIDYAVLTYNEIICLPDDKKEKIYNIIREILDL